MRGEPARPRADGSRCALRCATRGRCGGPSSDRMRSATSSTSPASCPPELIWEIVQARDPLPRPGRGDPRPRRLRHPRPPRRGRDPDADRLGPQRPCRPGRRRARVRRLTKTRTGDLRPLRASADGRAPGSLQPSALFLARNDPMSAKVERCELITIPISHYCEKARWALDRAGVRYRERAHLQVIHRFAVAGPAAGDRAGARLRRAGDPDSADIVAWPTLGAPPSSAVPGRPAAAAEVRALERDFDDAPRAARTAVDVRRAARTSRPRDRLRVHRRPGLAAPRPAARATRSSARMIDRYLDVSPATAAASVGQGPRRVRRASPNGSPTAGRTSCGERFTAADLTFAALAASVLMPPEYGVPLPQPDELPTPMATTVRELRAHPAGAHALRCSAAAASSRA